MDRKGIIAVILSVAVLVLWQLDNVKRTKAIALEKQRVEELAQAEALKNPAPVVPAPAGTPGAPIQAEAGAEEKIEKVSTPAVDYTLTNLGGGIQRAVLRKHQAEHDTNVVMNQFGPHAIGAFSETPGTEVAQAYKREEGTAENVVTFVRDDPRQVEIRKTFTLPKAGAETDEYLTQLEVTFTNKGTAAITLPSYYVYTGSAAPIHQIDQGQYTSFAWAPGDRFASKNVGTFTKGGVLGFGKEQIYLFQEEHADTAWAGVTSQYFSSIVIPLEVKGTAGWAKKFEVEKSLIGYQAPPPEPGQPAAAVQSATAGKAEVIDGALGMPGPTLQPGASQTVKFQLYTGPCEYRRLKAIDHGVEEIMDFGTFKIVSKALLNSMNWLHSKLGSYAAAIIILTLIIRGCMWPLQNKATQSMKKMQALQPVMNDLKAKYKDDPGRMNQELMKLYKDYQINPLAGCLPMVVQIPVFFGFFKMLGKAVELRHATFLWVKDLSQMDTVATIAGQPLNVLPLCMAVTMLWQMSLSPKSGDAVQQRVFMFMPLIFIFFCYKYASALALYWTVQNIFSVAQLYLTRKQTAPVLQKVPASSKKR